jgi:hypothetical protein
MKPCHLFLAISLSSALMLAVPAVHAATLTFGASLSGANENQVVVTPGTGNVTVVLDTIAQTLQINGSFANLTLNTTAAHIHCCQPLGTNAGVASVVPTFSGFPLGVTSGISRDFSISRWPRLLIQLSSLLMRGV